MFTCIEDKAVLDMPCMIEAGNRIVEVNTLFLSLTGYSEKEILGREVEEVWRQLLRINIDYYKIEELHEYNCYIFDISRAVKEVTISCSRLLGFKRFIYTFKQKKNYMFEDKFPFLELVNSTNETGAALYSVPDLILLKANKYYLKHFSKAYSNLEDILGRCLEDIEASIKNSKFRHICSEVVSSGQSVSFNEQLMELSDLDRSYSRYALTPIFEGGVIKYITILQNVITAKEDNREAIIKKSCIIEEQKNSLETQRDYLYKLFNALEMPIISLSYPEYRIVEFNRKAFIELREIAGTEKIIAESYLMGMTIAESIPTINNHSERVFFDQLEQTKSTIYHDKVEMEKNGHKVYYNMTYHPFLDAKGEITEILVVAVDVTNEVEKRNQMEDILNLKDEFFYLMSHEFKTPLTVINAAVQSLEHLYGKQIPDKAKALVEKVKQNTFRQLRLVNNLLDITRINSGKIKLKKRNTDIVFLTRVITESVSIYAQQKGVEICFKSKLSCRIVGIDDEKYERILLNLLSNAIKFTPAGKKVTVELSAKLHQNKRMVCIKVKDQGIGIPKDKQSIIFDRFEQVDSLLTRQSEGTGIGLFLVKKMVNAFEGEIFLESKEGKGSIFTIMIPSKSLKENITGKENKYTSDSRLVQSLAIEFSDIYL